MTTQSDLPSEDWIEAVCRFYYERTGRSIDRPKLTAAISDAQARERDIERGHELAEEHGW